MALARLLVPLAWCCAFAQPSADEGQRGPHYKLAWDARGTSFFDGFDFLQDDDNFGAAAYLDSKSAAAAGVIEAHDSHAIMRVGARVGELKRQSVKLQAKKGWKHFFMMARFSHLPAGCSLWPSIWFLGLDKAWPNGGELDVTEWANDGPQQVSFHVGNNNSCTLDKGAVNSFGNMPDLNNMSYDCLTDYSKGKLGCAPNKQPFLSGAQMSELGGIVAVESTPDHVKVFHIPEKFLPKDIDTADPKPWLWNRWIVSYYPFGLSEWRHPGSCPHPGNIVSPLHLTININMCGEWAGPIWKLAGSCVNKKGPQFPSQCSIVDPIGNQSGLGDDCCTQFVMDKDGKYGADEYFRENAFFNLSYVKVFERSTSGAAAGSAEIVV